MTANQIEDAGEQLVRNRRNRRNRVAGALSWDELQAMNPALRTRECVKAKVWPRPDFEALVRDGVPALAARVLKQVYDGVATRPLSESLEDMEAFVGAVEHVREAMTGWLTSNARHEFGALALAAMPAEAAPSRDAVRALHRHLIGVVWPDLVGVAPELWWPRNSARLAEVRAMGGSRVIRRLQVDPSEVREFIKEIAAGWPAAREAWQVQGMQILPTAGPAVSIERSDGPVHGAAEAATYCVLINAGKRSHLLAFGLSAEQAQAFRAALQPFVVLDKGGRYLGQFATEADAIAGARELARPKDSEGKVAASKRVLRAADSAQRDGRDWREGADKSAQDMLDTFGFRGVNFGNYVPDRERQAHLNASYEAFMDLSSLLKLPPQCMSLGGRLGLAIGAQGNGGRHAGHFVPGVNEINFTRTAGAGVAAHEWAHALDHAMAVAAGGGHGVFEFLSEYGSSGVPVDPAAIGNDLAVSMQRIVAAMRRRPAVEAEREAHLAKLRRGAQLAISQLVISTETRHTATLFSLLENGVDPHEPHLNLGTARSLGSRVPETIFRLYAAEKNARGRAPHWQEFATIAQRLIKVHTYLRSEPYVPSHYLEASRKMDAEKGGKPYWATDCEMFARAFSDWVRVRAAAQPEGAGVRVNDYLAPEFVRYDDLPHPHLEGEEASAVFREIDHLVEVIGAQAHQMFEAQACLDADAADEEDAASAVDRPRG